MAIDCEKASAALRAPKRCEEIDHQYQAGAYGVCERCGGETPIRPAPVERKQFSARSLAIRAHGDTGPRVGLCINGTADMSQADLHRLIDYLQQMANHLQLPDLYSKPKDVV